MSPFPPATGRDFGLDHGARARVGVPPAERPRLYPPPAGGAATDLSWYANSPVPTPDMGMREDFFGGYDYAAQAGLVHVADHAIAPARNKLKGRSVGPLVAAVLAAPAENLALLPAAIVAAGGLKEKRLILKLLAPDAAKTLPTEISLAVVKRPDPAALAVFLDGIGGRETVLRDPSRRAIEAMRGQTLAHRGAPPCQAAHGQALARLQRAFGKDDRATQGPLFEGDSTSMAPDADTKFAPETPPWGRSVTALFWSTWCSTRRSRSSSATSPRRSC